MRISACKIALAVLIFAPILSVPPVRGATPTLTLAEQEVIEALLSQDIGISISMRHVIKEYASIRALQPDKGVLQLDSTYDGFANSLRRQAKDRDEEFREALDNFLKKSRSPVQIVFPTNAPKGVELVSDATVDGIFSGKRGATPNGWDLFYRHFPDSGGLISISRVGIDSRGNVAVMYVGWQTGYRAGEGRIRFLRREGGKWILKSDERFGPYWRS
jgi:hypothetical protein